MAAGLALVVLLGTVATPAGAAPGQWDHGVATISASDLQGSGSSHLDAISCTLGGNCEAIGSYAVSTGVTQAMVASLSNAGTTWTFMALPGFAALDVGGGFTDIASISCPKTGDCVAGGNFTDSAGVAHAFVDSESSSTWGQPEEVPGFSVLSQPGVPSLLLSLSCPSVGNCAAGGILGASSTDEEPWVADEVNGTWGEAQVVPGIAGINVGQVGGVFSVSCASAQNCGATGLYVDSANITQTFVVNETAGTWGNALALTGAVSQSTQVQTFSPAISCAGPSSCSLSSNVLDPTGNFQAVVADEVNGTWGQAQLVAGANTPAGGSALFDVSCASVGNCASVGLYADASGSVQAMTLDERAGTWGATTLAPGSDVLNAGGGALLATVSCYANGYCDAAGEYSDSPTTGQVLVDDEDAGTWGPASELAGSAGANPGGDAVLGAVSCASDGSCGGVGSADVGSSVYQALATSTSPLFHVPSAPHVVARRASSSAVSLSLSSPGSNVPAITGYQYSINGGRWHEVGPHVHRVTIHHLRAGTTYRIDVRAVNSLGDGHARLVVVRPAH